MRIKVSLIGGFGVTLLAVLFVVLSAFVMLSHLADEWSEMSSVINKRHQLMLKSSLHLGYATLHFTNFVREGGSDGDRFLNELSSIEVALAAYRSMGRFSAEEQQLLDNASQYVGLYRDDLRKVAALRAAKTDVATLPFAIQAENDKLLAMVIRKLTDINNIRTERAVAEINRQIQHNRNGLLLAAIVAVTAVVATGTLAGRSVFRHDTERNQAMQALEEEIVERRRIENELIVAAEQIRQSEERFRIIFNESNEAIFIHDAGSGAILDVNRTMCELYGYTHEEALACNVGDLSAGIPPYTQADAMTWFQRAMTGEPQQLEWQARRKGGDLFWGEVKMRLVTIDNALRYIVTIRDITERKQAANDLRESEQRFRDIFDCAPIGMFRTTLDGCFIMVNQAQADIFGYETPEEMIAEVNRKGTAVILWPSPEARAEFMERVVAANGRYIQDEVHLLKKDRSELAVIFSVQLVTDSATSKQYITGFIQDITERKQAEEQLIEMNRRLHNEIQERCKAYELLQASEHKFASVFRLSPDAISITQMHDGVFLDVNDSFSSTHGYQRDEVIGRSSYDLNLWADIHDREEMVREMGSHGFVREKEVILRRKDGTCLTGLFSARSVSIDGVQCMLAVVRDITGRKLLEEQLHQSQKMESIGRLAGGVAHDFNNMLTVITGAAEVALWKTAKDEKLTKLLTQIKKAAERSSQITRQLLAFSRKQVISPKPVNLNSLLIESEKMLSRLISEDVSLSFHPATGLWITMIDPSQVDQILMNLCVNARDAMPNGGNLLLETANVHVGSDYSQFHLDAHPGEYVQLTVSDTGIGMDRETQQHIFEPFFTTKGIGEGTGLGLATVYGIVTQNNGFITVYSEPGQGTCFKIFLPRHMEEAPPEEKKENVPLIGTGTILLVEDEDMLLWTATQMLEGIGYTIIQAASAREAIAICAKGERQIDLVLTDVVMPEMNGKEMVEQIKTICPKIKVLFMSGYTADIVAQRGIVEEGMQFVPKPLDLILLHEKIETLLRSDA